jgi:hypothetical protein
MGAALTNSRRCGLFTLGGIAGSLTDADVQANEHAFERKLTEISDAVDVEAKTLRSGLRSSCGAGRAPTQVQISEGRR